MMMEPAAPRGLSTPPQGSAEAVALRPQAADAVAVEQWESQSPAEVLIVALAAAQHSPSFSPIVAALRRAPVVDSLAYSPEAWDLSA
jgi:hypothetical protein